MSSHYHVYVGPYILTKGRITQKIRNEMYELFEDRIFTPGDSHDNLVLPNHTGYSLFSGSENDESMHVEMTTKDREMDYTFAKDYLDVFDYFVGKFGAENVKIAYGVVSYYH